MTAKRDSEPPLAVVQGETLTELPSSLYLPPEAMRVVLDSFEGPLDLLHYLIRKNSMDVLDIPMVELTAQYLEYVDRIVASDMELVADYLLMSATLIEIKSRMLLPQPAKGDEDEEDPRATLVARLVEYSKIKGAAEELRARPIRGRDFWHGAVDRPAAGAVQPRISCIALLRSLVNIEDRRNAVKELTYATDTYTVREAMAIVLDHLRKASSWLFAGFLQKVRPNRSQASTIFVALLQLAKDQVVKLEQGDDAKGQLRISYRESMPARR